jgi:hypothetical protein
MLDKDILKKRIQQLEIKSNKLVSEILPANIKVFLEARE